jgi:hypothetical protein
MISNPTGRQFILYPFIKSEKFHHSIAKSLLILTIFCITGCNSKSDAPVRTYANPADALEDYESYLSEISKKKNASTKDIIAIMQEWKELDDTIANRFFANAYTDKATAADSSYVNIREKIIDGFTGMVDSRPRSLSDYLDVMTEMTKVSQDSLTTSLHRFYGAMDKTPTYKTGNAATVLRYEQTLAEALDKEIRTKQDLYTFLRAEDKAFRSFLEHLSTLGNIQLTKVRDNTSQILKQAVDLAGDKESVFTPKEIVPILTMRNNRRLIQNSLQCVNDIRDGKVNKDEQTAAYMWMLLQPWVSFDTYAFSLMSEAQLKTLRIIATETPKCISKLGNPDFPIDPDKLPTLLINTFISTL